MTEELERNKKIIEMAKNLWESDGEIKIDHVSDKDIPAMVSEGDDNGAYVKAWVWVDFAETELDKEGHDADED